MIVTLPVAAMFAAPVPFSTPFVMPAVRDEPVSVTLPFDLSALAAASVAFPPAVNCVPTACSS
ncbi:hypothetical protein WT14_32035 [Burkholderia stagnalis]|nr:hypothetical protein WT07_00155 [Burkholderia stagnalis]KVN53250.1 hypothetical protein WT14_32035 [Burkholderia stagnalis]KWE00244.1 hypothetical protein WT47_24320 [Burkholderia stagnalis]KWE07574.1 hypothetical protein WT48_27475 [Burkholderia stagnalis]KWO77969.1 hypothetical protein WU00_09500 [Burkholderia stagnalis]